VTTLARQTLQIVAAELGVTLEAARAALEAAAEQVEAVSHFATCAERMHEVRGVLRVVEVDGAALLAEEMEQVALFLRDSASDGKHNPEGLEALMRAMVQLPAYLERVMGGGRDLALILLPLLNDLRAVRGSPLLSEGTLLLLNLRSDRQPEPSRPKPGEPSLSVIQWARRLRPRFQLGLLGLLRNERPSQNLQVLAMVAERIEHVATNQSVFQLWWVIGALVESLLDGGIDSGSTIKRLLGIADRELKRLYEEGEKRYAETPPIDLLNNLLYYIARARSSGPRVEAVRSSFKLQELLPVSEQVEQERDSLSAPSVKLMHTVAAAIKEDLGRVKDVLDIFVRKGGLQVEDLGAQLDMLKKISDTLGVLGLGDLRQRVQEEVARLGEIVASRSVPDESALVGIAATLIGVEDNLDQQLVRMIRPDPPGAPADPSDDGEFRMVQDAVLRECMVNLARVKEIITAAVSDATASGGPDQVPSLLRGVQAGLLMLGKTQAVQVVEAIGAHVNEFVQPNRPRQSQRLDRLADAIVSLEYYMETLQSGRADPWYMLENAETCLRALDAADGPRPPAVQPVTLQSPAVEAVPVLREPEVAEAPRTSTTANVPVIELERAGLDPELIALFVEEAREEIQRVRQSFPAWEQNPADAEALARLRRSFHTLKGSGRMVGATNIGDFAWAIENLLNRIINGTLQRSRGMLVLLTAAIGRLPALVNALESGAPGTPDVDDLVAQANAFADGHGAEPPPVEDAAAAVVDSGYAVPPAASAAEPPSPPTSGEASLIATEVIMTTDPAVPKAPPPAGKDLEVPGRFVRIAREVAGGDEVADPHRVPVPPQSPGARYAPPTQVEAPPGPGEDAVLSDIYRKEVAGHLATIAAYLKDCEGRFPPFAVTDALHRSCHTLAGASKMAAARQGIKLAVPLNDYIRKLYDHQLGLPEGGRRVLADAIRAMQDVAENLNEETAFFASQADLLLRLKWLDADADREIGARGLVPRDEARTAEEPILTETAADLLAPDLLMEPAAPEPAPVAAREAAVVADVEPGYDHEIAAIFSEEATELLEAADTALAGMRLAPADRDEATALARVLHTLKGGARMAGVTAMGDLAHEFESLLLRVSGAGEAPDAHALGVMQQALDALQRMRDLVAAGRPVEPDDGLSRTIRDLAGDQPPAEPPAEAPPPAAPDPSLPVVTDIQASGPGVPLEPPTARSDETAAVPVLVPDPGMEDSRSIVLPPGREAAAGPEREVLARVDAELLDNLLNAAGEVSIFRARMEQQLFSVESNLGELGRVVLRLKDQMRKLEAETEAQILNKHEAGPGAHPDFDPLELDRYSSLQQYSRALAECVSDVASVQSLLESQSRDAQNLLMQQARLVTELQNGLMRTRMVPFQRHAQRLTRIVRQAAADSGKTAELVLTGASGELDRQVLERMLPPFEHLLRNAVVHGIESPAERAARGKPASGRVELSLRRDGSEVVILVRDDGAGMNLRAIRDKAISLGMLDPRRAIPDEDLVRFVLEPGFSTAQSLTQAAGRGIGMDVVATEIKKLGGALHIETTPGSGTQFTIRLPFTLAISQALIVRVGTEVYALPLPTVEGVVRLPKQEVIAHLAEDVPSFEYAGQRYRFQHLGAFIGGPASQLPEQDVPVPVVLVRAGESSTALVADELVGSREIVVKSVGPQIGVIRGVAGATILGDGRVVIILDIGTLVRGDWRSRYLVDSSADRVDRRTFALVVDDSITVRRVTQRLLERNGMRVMTAKDGVDAMAIMQEHVPDVILLDIEMPRMDGYEVAAQVRADARLSSVPIVMITSRSGEKHRARAVQLGVDDYLGKPYQENQLLDAIEPLVRRRREGA
jgi:chemosensory pili system protein ChpA (sensor histidine kinase/response regulator)